MILASRYWVYQKIFLFKKIGGKVPCLTPRQISGKGSFDPLTPYWLWVIGLGMRELFFDWGVKIMKAGPHFAETPLNPARRSAERCKLPPVGSGAEP